MIDPSLFAAFVLATTVLMLIPGPNWALITANSVAHGVRYGLLTVVATSVAVTAQLGLVTLGLAAALGAAHALLSWLRWAGVLYLLWLGLRELRSPAADLARIGAAARAGLARRIVARGLAVALTNPKTMLFFAAFFPQFITPDAPAGPQIAVMTCAFIAVNVAVDSLWAVLAARARASLLRRARLRKGVTGGLLIGAGLSLGWTNRG